MKDILNNKIKVVIFILLFLCFNILCCKEIVLISNACASGISGESTEQFPKPDDLRTFKKTTAPMPPLPMRNAVSFGEEEKYQYDESQDFYESEQNKIKRLSYFQQNGWEIKAIIASDMLSAAQEGYVNLIDTIFTLYQSERPKQAIIHRALVISSENGRVNIIERLLKLPEHMAPTIQMMQDAFRSAVFKDNSKTVSWFLEQFSGTPPDVDSSHSSIANKPNRFVISLVMIDDLWILSSYHNKINAAYIFLNHKCSYITQKSIEKGLYFASINGNVDVLRLILSLPKTRRPSDEKIELAKELSASLGEKESADVLT